ncbi:MAG: DUF1080 domain-containing protein [Verrucomicrobiae bacterium]|nr:DUF1080 domain-containing protein [Verrucomicrobiae bacterium]
MKTVVWLSGLGVVLMSVIGAAGAVPTNAPSPGGGRERSLFDGKTHEGWAVTRFAGRGEVRVDRGLLVLEQGFLTGIHWTNDLPQTNYEISMEARRVNGNDFFCGLTFPIQGTNATLIVGGWGGGLVGISSIDGYDASENETTTFHAFKREQWYAIRVRVTSERLEAWLDQEKIVDVKVPGRTFGLRSGPIEESVPLGVATYETEAHLRNIVLRYLQ